MMVMALIALLASVLIANLVPLLDDAEKKAARTFVSATGRNALVTYRMHTGRFPSTAEGLNPLIQAPEGAKERWNGPYFDPARLPVDPWNRPYHYRHPGTKNAGAFDLYSLGPDGVESADDIGNWE
jgi:general secretion pathway protein G